MGEIRIVGPGKTRGYSYLVCKKRIVGPGKTRGYPYPVCKKIHSDRIYCSHNHDNQTGRKYKLKAVHEGHTR